MATKRDRFISVPDAAKELGVSAWTMDQILREGEIEYMTPHKQRRVSLNSLKLYRDRVTANKNVQLATVDDDPLQ